MELFNAATTLPGGIAAIAEAVNGPVGDPRSRSVSLYILNESHVTLMYPVLRMWNGHQARNGRLPSEIVGRTRTQTELDVQPVEVRFEKGHASPFGCKGWLLYRYNESRQGKCYVAIKFAVPEVGPNRCSVAILSENERFLHDNLRKYLNPVSPSGKQGDDIDKMHNTEFRWMRIEDTEENIAFECRMMPGSHEIDLLLWIKTMQVRNRSKTMESRMEDETSKGCSLM